MFYKRRTFNGRRPACQQRSFCVHDLIRVDVKMSADRSRLLMSGIPWYSSDRETVMIADIAYQDIKVARMKWKRCPIPNEVVAITVNGPRSRILHRQILYVDYSDRASLVHRRMSEHHTGHAIRPFLSGNGDGSIGRLVEW